MARTLLADDREMMVEVGGGNPRGDTMSLAVLMLDAYRGTIDDEGETLEDAVSVIGALFAGEFGAFDDNASIVFSEGGDPIAATFVTHHDGRPLVAFSITNPVAARRGFARRGLRHAIGVLARAGHADVRLVVTDGNDRAVALYASEGFVVVADSA